MGDFDERVTDGLRELGNRAPVHADVWEGTARYVMKHRRHRQAFAASSIIMFAAVVVAGSVLVASHGTRPRQVTTAKQPPVAPTVTSTTATTGPETTTTIVPVRSSDACPSNCIRRVRADVDGDGRPDTIGLMATPNPNTQPGLSSQPGLNMKLVLRVVFANGRVAEYKDSAYWKTSLIGAADANGDGKAELFFVTAELAHSFSGQIVRWDGSDLVAVKGSDGKPFLFDAGGVATFSASGFRCAGNSIIATWAYLGNGSSQGQWSGTQTTYRWQGNQLLKVVEQPIVFANDMYNRINGAHCAGLSGKLPAF